VLVAVLQEIAPGERRVALVPDAVRAVVRAGLEVAVQTGAGVAAGFDDAAYRTAGARVESDPATLAAKADVLLKVQPPSDSEIAALRAGSALIGFLRPLDEPARVARLAGAGITSFAMELLPRVARAQAMDALSSQASIAGYRAVLRAAVTQHKMFPMMTTAAGTISPARVLVVGAGVAGLQAIATAKRLGAVVEAYDTRAAVKEQVQSLGARFVELELDARDAEDAGGYARAQSEAFLARQREQLGVRIRAADVVITTALVPGERAPLLIDAATARGMRPGSVIVDLAASAGGNCALTRPDEEVEEGGVKVLGPTNLPAEAAGDASSVYARNVSSFLLHLVKDGALAVDLEDEIIRESLLTHAGRVTQDRVRSRLGAGEEASA
jgi:proton-translocating NAD(P)+ transhydrogenase subunit alpha